MKKLLKIRWILMAMALAAIVGLTGMNVYSLYALHESTVNAQMDAQKNQLADFSYMVRNRFRPPVEGIWKINMQQLHEEFLAGAPLNTQLEQVLREALEDPLFDAIYYAEPDFERCQSGVDIRRYDPDRRDLIPVREVPSLVCDGLGLARTRMNVLINEYRFNTKVNFDTHRSMTIAMINPRGSAVVGYFNLVINVDYLIHGFLATQLVEVFGSQEQSGMTIWLHDWIRNEVLAVNDTDLEYDRRQIQYIQRFPDLLDSWNLKVVFSESRATVASETALIRNLIVLTGGVFLLIGTLVVMFVITQRERRLVDRQAGFIANVTHELKTPLAVMQAAGENLADGRVRDPERLKTYGEHIHTESIRLRSMIEKLLDVARSDAGQHQLKPSVLDPGELVSAYVMENQAMFASAGFKPEIQIQDQLPAIFADRDSFLTILGNLVENAMKYSTNEKYLRISLDSNSQQVRLMVEDRGVGIPPRSRKLIFERFYRVEDPLTARTKGHGLGLSIVKMHAELNGGRVSVISEYQKGSTFIVEFPVHYVRTGQETVTIKPESKVEYAS